MTATVIPFPVPAAKQHARAAFIDRVLSPLPAHEVQADSAAYRQQLAMLTNIERYSEIIASRPNNRPPEKGAGPSLKTPACAHGCKDCYMQCAIAPERLKWWTNELARL